MKFVRHELSSLALEEIMKMLFIIPSDIAIINAHFDPNTRNLYIFSTSESYPEVLEGASCTNRDLETNPGIKEIMEELLIYK